MKQKTLGGIWIIKSYWLLFLLAQALIFQSCSPQVEVLDISGEWKLAYGIKVDSIQQINFDQTILLPGSMQEQGFGYQIDVNTEWTGQVVDSSWYTSPEYARFRQDDVKVPFWLNPNRVYVGEAWYQKEITIPGDWKGRELILFLERTHWETTVFLNNQKVGTENSLATPHTYLLTGFQTGKNILTIKVDNSMIVPVGVNAHSVSDHTQTNWNGIIGEMKIFPREAIEIQNLFINPVFDKNEVHLKAAILNHTDRLINGRLIINVVEKKTKKLSKK